MICGGAPGGGKGKDACQVIRDSPFLPAESMLKSCVSCWCWCCRRRRHRCCCGEQFAGSFYLLQCTYSGFINYLWGGILHPQLSSSFLLIDFGSKNSLQGGIPQKFVFNFSTCLHSLPKWTKSMSILQVFEQSLFNCFLYNRGIKFTMFPAGRLWRPHGARPRLWLLRAGRGHLLRVRVRGAAGGVRRGQRLQRTRLIILHRRKWHPCSAFSPGGLVGPADSRI